jgi:hypothetical protein
MYDPPSRYRPGELTRHSPTTRPVALVACTPERVPRAASVWGRDQHWSVARPLHRVERGTVFSGRTRAVRDGRSGSAAGRAGRPRPIRALL